MPLPKVTLKHMNEVKHAAFKEREFYFASYQASVALARFYKVELMHMEDTGRTDMGHLSDGTARDAEWFGANIRRCELEARDYMDGYRRLSIQLANMNIMVHARRWAKELP